MDNIDQDFFNKFVQNRVENSNADLINEDPKERVKLINTLFKMLIGMYGRNFADQFDNPYAKEIWLNALLVFKKEDIAKGLDLMLQDPNFQSAPNLKKFILYCDDAQNGKDYIKEKKRIRDAQKLPKLKKLKTNNK
jgi:hypothetical protein